MRNKYITLWVMTLVVALGLAVWFLLPVAATTGAASDTRSNEGPVQFHLTPLGVRDGTFQVAVQVDTHSGSLGDLDLRAATVLRAGGKAYRPVAPVSLGGHHAGARLVFALAERPEAFEITIEGVRDMGTVTYRWP